MSKIITSRSRNEEIANALTHAFGVLFSVVGLFIVFLTPDVLLTVRLSTAIFLISMLLLYAFSFSYHIVQEELLKKKLRYFDHIGIYFLIAGSYSPFLLLAVKGSLGWAFFIFIWLVAFIGVLYKIFWWKRYPKLSLYFYLGMGWLVVFIAKPMYENLPLQSLLYLLLGGVFYSLGTIFYAKKNIAYTHVIWHLFVLAGSLSHYIAILKIR